MSVLYGTSAFLCLLGGHFYFALCCTALCALANPVMIWKALHQSRAALRRYNLNPVLLAGIALGLLAGVVLALAWVEPAHAQFFGNAEKFINKVVSGNGAVGGAVGGAVNTNVVALVMGTLRLLFVMYMLFGIVQVFQAVRQGEEWKDLARTPFFVVLAGTLGDVLVGAITG